MSSQDITNLIVSYVPEHHDGDPLLADIVFSESYEEIIEAACKIWAHHLPPRHRVACRSLARQFQRPNSPEQWVTLQPERLVGLMRNRQGATDVLELRLQIECFRASTNSINSDQQESGWISALEQIEALPNHLSPSNSVNPGHHDDTIESNNSSASPRDSSARPLTPQSGPEAQGLEQSPISPISLTSSMIPTKLSPTLARSRFPAMRTMFDEGLAAFHAGRYADSRIYFSQAANEFHKDNNILAEAHCFRHMGKSYRNTGDHTSARSHLWAARAMYESIGIECQQEQFRCTRHLALVEEDLGNHETALVTYQQLLRSTERGGFSTQRAWCLCYIGHLYSKMKRYHDAMGILDTALETQLPDIRAFATEGLGLAEERQGHPQKAMDHYKKALQIYQDDGNSRHTADGNRVKKRMSQLSREAPTSAGVSRRWSIARTLRRIT